MRLPSRPPSPRAEDRIATSVGFLAASSMPVNCYLYRVIATDDRSLMSFVRTAVLITMQENIQENSVDVCVRDAVPSTPCPSPSSSPCTLPNERRLPGDVQEIGMSRRCFSRSHDVVLVASVLDRGAFNVHLEEFVWECLNESERQNSYARTVSWTRDRRVLWEWVNKTQISIQIVSKWHICATMENWYEIMRT